MTTNNNPIRSSSISTKQNPIPPCIVTALSKPQDKLYILHLEKDLINFIRNSILGNIKQPEYIIQAQYLKNSYYRLLCHQLCQYYCLQHWNTPFNEIIVTPTLNFDYKQYLDEESFVKISSVSHKYKTESEPVQHEPIQREPVKKLLVRKPIDAPSTPVDDDEKKLDFVNEVQDVDIEAKRALYMKLREEIFDNNDEEEEDEEEDEEKHHDADVVDNI